MIIAIVVSAMMSAQDRSISRHILCDIDSLLSIEGRIVSYSEKRMYAEVDELNGWACRDNYYEKAYLRKRQDFVDNFVADIKLYSLGRVEMNASYDSELLLRKWGREVAIYLVSRHEDRIASVVNIYQTDGGFCEKRAVCIGSGTYMRVKYCSSDVLDQEQPVCTVEVEDVFFLDEQGKVVHCKSTKAD